METQDEEIYSPFMSAEESFIVILRGIFLNGDIISSSVLQQALMIPEELAVEVMSHVIANIATNSTPDECEEDLKEQGQWMYD